MLLLCCAVCCSTRCGDVATPGLREALTKASCCDVKAIHRRSPAQQHTGLWRDGIGTFATDRVGAHQNWLQCHWPLYDWWLKGAWLTETG